MRDPLYRLCLFGLHLFAWLIVPDGVWLPDGDKLVVQSSTESEDVPWDYIVAQHFAGADFDTAMSIIACESSFDPTADNPASSARGGWQFLRSTWEWVQADSGLDLDDYPDGPDDPYQSTAAAAWLQAEAGWRQWSCYGVRPRQWDEPVTIDLLPESHPGRG